MLSPGNRAVNILIPFPLGIPYKISCKAQAVRSSDRRCDISFLSFSLDEML
jgi:hypothetical protein